MVHRPKPASAGESGYARCGGAELYAARTGARSPGRSAVLRTRRARRTALFGNASPSYSITRRASSSASLRAPSDSGSLTLSAGISAEALTELLEALGLIRCWWERESQDEIIEVNKFVQGVCPPGSF